MIKFKTLLLGVSLPLVLLHSLPVEAALRVLACEPEWGALAQELGGKLVDVSVATSGLQDPHQIQAKPSLIARARNADLVVCTGAELEIGWLPVLLQQSGNAKVQPGQPGNFAAADFVRKLDLPTQLDRSQGDVHAAGNPHIQTDPRNIALVAAALGARLQQIDPAHAADYAKAQADFSQRWQLAIARWTTQAAPLRGVSVASQHKAFVYLYDWLGLKEVAVLEPKPGVEPSASHLQTVLATLKAAPARMVLVAALPGRTPVRMAEQERRHRRRQGPVHRRRHRRREGLVRIVRRHGGASARRRQQAMNWAALDWGILGPALIAGMLVLATHVPLGTQVLDRGIVFIDLAIAQIAGLGVIAADAIGMPEGGMAVQLAAVSAALLGALLLTWTERKAPRQQEALIGVMFILAACAGILLLAGNPHGGEHLKELLVGQILWVTTTQLLWLAGVSALLLAALWLGWVERLGRFGFYAAFALAVTASVQLVGVYLVFSSLIIPALATRASLGRRRLALGYLLGATGYGLGLALSALLDLPSGAVIVWTLAICAICFVAFQPDTKAVADADLAH